jgi:hypothetical protein
MVGCGKLIPTGVAPFINSCCRPCGSDPKQLCKECLAKRGTSEDGLKRIEQLFEELKTPMIGWKTRKALKEAKEIYENFKYGCGISEMCSGNRSWDSCGCFSCRCENCKEIKNIFDKLEAAK